MHAAQSASIQSSAMLLSMGSYLAGNSTLGVYMYASYKTFGYKTGDSIYFVKLWEEFGQNYLLYNYVDCQLS